MLALSVSCTTGNLMFCRVIRESEMLVVLGRPGSGCSTLLKTIAGETHGLNITESSHINYQGKLRSRFIISFVTHDTYVLCRDIIFPHA
jgi:ATP-binding cassette, subfamily G (WHITE), member 2, PDR